jgi:hypothetical protein
MGGCWFKNDKKIHYPEKTYTPFLFSAIDLLRLQSRPLLKLLGSGTEYEIPDRLFM